MLHSGCVKRHQKSRDFVGLPMGLLREGSPKKRMNTGLLGSRSGEIRSQSSSSRSAVQQAIIFAMAMSHATSNIKSFVHACMRRSFFIWCHRAKPVTEENRRFFEGSKANRWENGSKSPENQGFPGFFYAWNQLISMVKFEEIWLQISSFWWVCHGFIEGHFGEENSPISLTDFR